MDGGVITAEDHRIACQLAVAKVRADFPFTPTAPAADGAQTTPDEGAVTAATGDESATAERVTSSPEGAGEDRHDDTGDSPWRQ